MSFFPPKPFHLLWLDWDVHLLPSTSLICRPWGDDNETSIETLPLNTPFNLSCRFSDDRYCIGCFDSNEYLTACKRVARVQGSRVQCDECFNNDPSQRCTACHGECDLPSEYCTLPHIVYLAAYTPTDVKVGVCRRERFGTRIAEQGALMAIPIARADDGRVARELEAKIHSTFGVPDKVRPKVRLSGFRPNQDAEACARLLVGVRSQVFSLPELDGTHYLDNQKPLDLLTPYNDSVSAFADFVPQSISIRDTKTIRASVIAIKGWDFLLRIGESLYVLHFKEMIGRTISPASVDSLVRQATFSDFH
ncbi:MAG: DUF2797 domain-containing protein [Nitrososphaerales archaeon]